MCLVVDVVASAAVAITALDVVGVSMAPDVVVGPLVGGGVWCTMLSPSSSLDKSDISTTPTVSESSKYRKGGSTSFSGARSMFVYSVVLRNNLKFERLRLNLHFQLVTIGIHFSRIIRI